MCKYLFYEKIMQRMHSHFFEPAIADLWLIIFYLTEQWLYYMHNCIWQSCTKYVSFYQNWNESAECAIEHIVR